MIRRVLPGPHSRAGGFAGRGDRPAQFRSAATIDTLSAGGSATQGSERRVDADAVAHAPSARRDRDAARHLRLQRSHDRGDRRVRVGRLRVHRAGDGRQHRGRRAGGHRRRHARRSAASRCAARTRRRIRIAPRTPRGDRQGNVRGARTARPLAERLEAGVGEMVRVIPNHVCIVVHLNDTMHGVRGDVVERSWPVDARGRAPAYADS